MILDIPFEELDGHARQFIWCKFENEDFVVISGKFHFYEGHSFQNIISPLKFAVDILGVDDIIVTSASGGLSNRIKTGEWTYLKQVICVPEVKMDMAGHADRVIRKGEKTLSFDDIQDAVYAYHQGPSLGSVAEYKMLNGLDADLVGMSMFPEYCYLKSIDIRSHFLSLPVCNYFPFKNVEEPSFEEVLEISSASVPVLADLYKIYLRNRNIT
jgi:purine-nucleoside phosphorylase